MQLYLISRTDKVGWDEYAAVLVRAANEKAAIATVIDRNWPEHLYGVPALVGFERDGTNLKCERVTQAGAAGIVIADWRAG